MSNEKCKSTKILLLEDDKLFNDTLQDFLEEEGFCVDVALDPYSALDYSYENNYDLYLFDVNLPYENGFTLLERLRTSGDVTPTIFLTSRADKMSLTQGFTTGADDYLKKPVDLDELLLRIYAVLRRQTRLHSVSICEFTLSTLEKKLYDKEGMSIPLSPKALTLLTLLVEARGEVLSLERIVSRLWSSAEEVSHGAIRVYITQLKKYFPTQIKNIRGLGYKMVFE